MSSSFATVTPRVTRATKLADQAAHLQANPNIRGRIAAILALPLDGPWVIADSDVATSVYLVSYRTQTQDTGLKAHLMQDRIRPQPRYQNLRGVVVYLGDTAESDQVLIDNYVFTPRATAAQLVPAGTMVTVTTEYGDKTTFDLTTAKLRRYREGVVIRIFHFRGTTYFATSSKLQAQTGMWSPSAPNFYQMYLDMAGLPLEQLFAGQKTHPYYYSLLLAHPGIQVASLADPSGIVLLEEGLLGGTTALGQEAIFQHQDQVSRDLILAFATIPKDLTVAEANRHLTVGTLPETNDEGAYQATDPRLGLGEALLVTVPGSPSQAYKIESPAYQWRFDVHGNQPSYYTRFIMLLSARVLGMDDYMAAWPDLVSAIPVLEGQDGPGRDLNTIWGKTYNMYLGLIQASPFHRRGEMANVIVRLFGQAPVTGQVIGGFDQDGQPTPVDFRNYLLDPRDGGYEGDAAVPGVSPETGDLISVEHYLAELYDKYTNFKLFETVDKTTMFILNSVKTKVENSTESWGSPEADSVSNKRNFFIHQMLYAPTPDFNVSGVGLNRVIKEMKTAVELAKKPDTYVVPNRYHEPGAGRGDRRRVPGRYPIDYGNLAGLSFSPAASADKANLVVSPSLVGVTFGDFAN